MLSTFCNALSKMAVKLGVQAGIRLAFPRAMASRLLLVLTAFCASSAASVALASPFRARETPAKDTSASSDAKTDDRPLTGKDAAGDLKAFDPRPAQAGFSADLRVVANQRADVQHVAFVKERLVQLLPRIEEDHEISEAQLKGLDHFAVAILTERLKAKSQQNLQEHQTRHYRNEDPYYRKQAAAAGTSAALRKLAATDQIDRNAEPVNGRDLYELDSKQLKTLETKLSEDLNARIAAEGSAPAAVVATER